MSAQPSQHAEGHIAALLHPSYQDGHLNVSSADCALTLALAITLWVYPP